MSTFEIHPSILDIDLTELAVRLCEANNDIVRPPHLTAEGALAEMDPDCREGWESAARTALQYIAECIEKQRPKPINMNGAP
jgi:hypothetical protein